MRTIALLFISNIFMTFAWYGHLRHQSLSMPKAILISWLIAGLEYVFMVPANRLGAMSGWSAYQLKVAQEAITLVVFIGFAWLYLHEKMQWNHLVAFALIMGAVFFTFRFQTPTVH
jgi:uncharacterized protein